MRKLALTLALALAAVALDSSALRAEPNDPVVVSVGGETMTASALEKRIDAVPLYQLRTFGATPDEMRRGFVDEIIVPELLLTAEARRRKLEADPAVRDRVTVVLRAAMMSTLRVDPDSISDEDVRRYYAENSARFDTPARIRISRILVASEADARELLKEARALTTPERWDALCREKSLDKATAMREGNLGFVEPDGRTETPRVRVEPSLYEAAARVKDGEFVPEPVPEGPRWAVVWRRGSMPAVERSVEQEARSIRQIIARERSQGALDALLARLTKERVRDRNDALLDYVSVTSFGDLATRARPGQVPRRRGAGKPVPETTERGLR